MAAQMARIRVWGAVCFLLIALGSSFWPGERGSRAILPGLLGYCAGAVLLREGMRRARFKSALTILWPFLDVGFVVGLRLATLQREPQPGITAAWTVSILMLIVMMAALSLGRRMGLAVAAFAFAGAAVMLTTGGAIPSLIVASGAALLLANEGASWAARMLERAAERDQAQRQAEDLIAFLVHDMKNPLAVASLVLEGVQRRAVDPQTRADMLAVEAQHQRLLGMFGDMLALARLEKGALELQRKPTRIPALLAQVVQPHEAWCASAHIELSTSAAAADLSAEIDAPLVHRALENLVSNAISKVEAGARVRVEAWREDGWLLLAVRNTGSEIPLDVRPRLFEKYASDRREGAHAGLGLYYCRLVAEAHQGSIALEESAQWPVSFVLRLPARAT